MAPKKPSKETPETPSPRSAKNASPKKPKNATSSPSKKAASSPSKKAASSPAKKAASSPAKKAASSPNGTASSPAKKARFSGDISLRTLIHEDGWKTALADELTTEYFLALEKLVLDDYRRKEVFPPKDLIFNALNSTPIYKVKVVILGQDPYHDDGQAHGLSFSVPKGKAIPPSLRNIYKEMERDVKAFKTPDHGCLEKWAENGVLLLNATLTVEAHQPNSHAKYGWQKFTDSVIRILSKEQAGVVFILWGGFAHKKEKLIDMTKHTVIKTAHPSPLSFNKFMNCGCFSQTNDALKKYGLEPVDWSLS